MAFRNYILCFALVAGTIAGPINVQDGDIKCAKTCTESLSDNTKFQYAAGTTYVYQYEGNTVTKLQGSSEQSTSLTIKATADIEVITKCEFALKLSSVTLAENGTPSSGSSEFSSKLQANTLRFAFQDGRIEHICSQNNEDERVLNIKRGILSAFQNSMDQLTTDGQMVETDVSGVCPTTYTHKSTMFSGTTITKSKDILACTERNGNMSSIQAEKYVADSRFQNTPLLSSSVDCEQHITSGRIEKSTCTEVLMFRPFHKDGSGAVTTTAQTLQYSTYRNSVSTAQSAIQARSSLLFSHVYDESIDVNAKSDVIGLLREICSETNEDITRQTPILFGALISKMKRLSADKMMQVYNSVNGDRICTNTRGKQFFFDAIPMVSTEASLALMHKLISEKTVQGTEADLWLTQLAFIPRPTYNMLAMIKPLLEDSELKSKTLLGISAMVHKLCEVNADCHRNPEVISFINSLNQHIGADCAAEERDLLIVTLKAIGNAGNAVTSSSVIGRCITKADADTEVKIAALKAYRRMPCSVSREDAMRLYQNAENDAELRIHAFLAVMSCPTTDVLTKVRMMLSGEPVNQVGSFVWTYLENIKESASPLKQELASILDDAKLREDFNCDVRKFSRNIEKSFFSDYLNVGAQVESNLIWSQNSYIPRSAMLNMSMEMFGNSINLLEVGGRVQGLESILEKFFGPNGYFTKDQAKELMDNKRQTANYVSPFDTMFKTPNDEIRSSMYIKMFGNEIRYNELSDFSELKNFNVLNLLIKLAEPKRIDITKNYQFIDSSLIIPTTLGLPMNLTVNGTASVSLDINGNVDLRNVAASPRNLDIQGHIKPSAAIVISGVMGVDAIVAKSSMKLVSTMHSSTQLDGKIQLQDGQIFNVELNTPREKMEIFHIQTEFFMNGAEMRMPEAEKTYKKCTGAAMTKVAGVEFCVDVTLPTFHKTGLPLPPFTGPMNAQITMEKKDTHTGYTFVAKMENTRQRVSGTTVVKRVAHLSIDTPGSQVDRKLLLEGTFDPATMSASAQMMSPWKKVAWNANLKNDQDMKSAETSLTIDTTQEYAAKAQLETITREKKTIWKPTVTISLPNKPTMTIDGSFETGTGKTMAAAELNILKFTRKPITMSASLEQKKAGAAYGLKFNTNSDYMTVDYNGNVDVRDGSYNLVSGLDYTVSGRPEHRFTVSGKFLNRSAGALKSFTVQGGLISTEFPHLNVAADGSLETTANHVDMSLELSRGDHKIVLTHKTTKRGDLMNMNAESEMQTATTFKIPTMAIDYSATADHKLGPNMVSTSGSITYAPSKTISTSVKLDRQSADRPSGEIALSYPGRDMKLSTAYNKLGDNEHQVDIQCQWDSDMDSKMSISTTVKMADTHEITGEIKFPGHPIALTASIKPNLKDFHANTQLTYKQHSWSNSVEYKLTTDSFHGKASSVCSDRTVSVAIDLNRSNTQMTGEINMSLRPANAEAKTISLSGEYNMRDTANKFHRDVKITATTPYGSFATSTDMINSVSLRSLESEMNLNGELSKFKAELSNNNGWIASMMLDTPYIQYGPVKALSARASYIGKDYDVEFSWSPSQKVSGAARYIANGDMYKVKVDYTTPFRGYERFGFDAEFTKSTTNVMNAEFYLNDKRASLNMQHTGINSGEFTLTYPGRVIAGSFTQNGKITEFEAETAFSWDENMRITAKVNLNTAGPISAGVQITTPFAYKKVNANFQHSGEPMDFHTQAVMSWDRKKINAGLKFSGKEAELTVRTPWRDIMANYLVTGTTNAFTTSAKLQWAEDKTISARLNANFVNDYKLDFNAATPFFDEVTANLEHSGSMNNFNNKAEFTWAPTKTVSVTSQFSNVNGITVGLTMNAPTVEFTASHNGDFKAWKNEMQIQRGNSIPQSIYSEFDSDKHFAFKVGVKNSGIEIVGSAEVNAELKTIEDKVSAVTTMTYANSKVITSRVMLAKKNGYSLSALLKTPFTEDMSADITHTGSMSNFQNEVELVWAPTKKISAVTNFNMKNGFEAKSKIETPWKQLSFSANQQGTAQEFTSRAAFSWDQSQQISASLEFSHINDLSLKMNMQTPFDLMRKASLTISHRGTDYTTFSNQIEAALNEQRFTLGTNFNMRNGVRLTVTSTNPWQNFNAVVSHSGDSMEFTNKVEVNMDAKKYFYTLEFSRRSDISLKCEFTGLYSSPFSAELTISGTQARFTTTWAPAKTITGEATFDMTNMLLTGSFTTPFKGYTNGELRLQHEGNLKSFNSKLEITFSAKTAKLQAGFTTFGQTKGSLIVESPWFNANGSFEHTGDFNNFSNKAEITFDNKTHQITSRFNKENLSGTVELTSPFKSGRASFNGRYENKSLTAHAEATWEAQTVKTDLTFQMTPSVEAELNVSSPWKNFAGKYTHQGSWTERCNTVLDLTWGEKKIYSAWNISMMNGVTADITVTTPWRNVAAEFKHEGKLESFENTMSVTYETGKTARLVTEFTLRPDVLFRSTLTSPMKNANIMYRHSGDMNHFTCRLEGVMDNTPITSDLLWDMRSGVDSSIDLRTPWKNVKAEFKTQGDLTNLSSFASAEWDNEKIDARLSFSKTQGTLTVNTPWKNLNAEFEHTGTLENFQTKASLSWEAGKQISTDVEWSNRPTRAGSLKIMTPWRNMSMNYRGQGTITNHSSTTSVSWETGKTITMETKLDLETQNCAELKIATPWKTVSAKYDHTGNLQNFMTTASASWEADKIVSGEISWTNDARRSGSIKIKSPWRNLSATYAGHGNRMNYDTTTTVSWEDNKTITLEAKWNLETEISTDIKLNTPWRAITTSMAHTGNMKNFRTVGDFSWESGKIITVELESALAAERSLVTFKVTNPWRNISASCSHSGVPTNFQSTISATWDQDKTISVDTSFDITNGVKVENKITSPWRNLSFQMAHSGPWTNMENELEFSWETGKTIKSKFNMDVKNYSGEWSLDTPWRNMDVKAQYSGTMEKFTYTIDVHFDRSMPTAKTTTTLFLNQKQPEFRFKALTPWRNVEFNGRLQGDLTKFSAETDFSWEDDKKVSAQASFSLEPMSGNWKITIPGRVVASSFSHTGSRTNMSTRANFSWDSDKEISWESNVDLRSGYKADAKLATPWKTFTTEMNHRGDFTDMTNTFEFSWEATKKVSTNLAFKLEGFNLDTTVNVKTPFTENIEATILHKFGDECSTEAKLSWAPNKKIDLSAKFNLVTPYTGTVSLKTPFYKDISAKYEHSGDMNEFTNLLELDWTNDKIAITASKTYTSAKFTLEQPFTGTITAEVKNALNWDNWEAEFNHGEEKFTGMAVGETAEGYKGKLVFTTPFAGWKTLSAEIEHTGTATNFKNMIELKKQAMAIKSDMEFNMANNKIQHSVEVTAGSTDKYEWNAEYTTSDKEFTAKLMAAKNDKRFGADINASVEYKKYKVEGTSAVTVSTPFAGFEDNKFEASVSYSQRMLEFQATGYLGSAANTKKFELFAKNTSTATRTSATAYIKSDLMSEEESSMTLDFNMEGDRTIMTFQNDLKFAPALYTDMKLDVTHSRTSTDFNHAGSLELTCSKGAKKLVWNAGSNHYMCETGMTFTMLGQQKFTFAHKTTWTSSYNKMEHDMTFKSNIDSFTMPEDSQFKMMYDFTLPKKTVSITMFNEPSKPFDLKAEMQMDSNISVMAELTTPITQISFIKVEADVVKAQQPWAVTLKGKLNDQAFTANGNLKVNGVEDVEGNLKFSSPIPMFEDLQMTFKNARLQNQWRPNMSLQWASDKRVELSGTFLWTNQYKAAIDLSTPFESMRSMTADVSVSKTSDKLTTSLEFKTSKMAEKMSANLMFSGASKTASVTVSSPFEMLRTFEMSAAMTPRLSVIIERNGQNLFQLRGNGQYANWQSHSLDVEITYPFLNKYMRIKVNNDLSLESDKTMSSDMEFEYTKGKTVTFKFDMTTLSSTKLDVQIMTPFEKFEKTRYSLLYTGSPEQWTENTEFEFYYGKIVTRTTFGMTNGITWHQTVTGSMRNGVKDFTLNKDFVFSGDLDNFSVEASLKGTSMPELSFESKWQRAQTGLTFKATFNQYNAEYTHTGPMTDFTCTWKIVKNTEAYNGTWSFKLADNKVNVSTRISTPTSEALTLNLSGNYRKAMFNAYTLAANGKKQSLTHQFDHRAMPYTSKTVITVNNAVYGEGSYSLQKDDAEFTIKGSDSKVLVALQVANKLNADEEYTPSVTLTLPENKIYEFDGLYKNVGEGRVRDFKLHLNGPRGLPTSVNFKFDFRTASSQFVPMDAAFFLSYTDRNGSETQLVDLKADIGNDHAAFTFNAPKPMKYSIDFSVNTRGQSGEIVANWDTRADDKNFKMTFENKLVSYSARTKSYLDIDIVYRGVSRGFTSDLDWKTNSINHKFTVDYNGKQVGYNLAVSHESGCVGSVELITPFRNVKGTWNHKPADFFDIEYAFYWDSANDATKKVSAHTTLKETATNTFELTTSVSHPALNKDLVLTKVFAYNTDTVRLSYKSTMSYSADSSKDIVFETILEKNGKWGVELKQLYNNIDMKLGTEFTKGNNAAISNMLMSYKDSTGSMKKMGLRTSYNLDSNTYSIELTTPIKTIKFESKTTIGETTNIVLTATVDNKAYKTTISYKPTNSYMMVKVNFDPMDARNNIEFEAMKLSKGYQMKLIKQQNGEVITEGLAAISMNENKTINGKLYWNPTLYSEVKTKIDDLKSELKQLVKDMHIASKTEVTRKTNSLQLGNDFEQIMPVHSQEMESISADYQKATRQFNRAYNQDVMLMKTTHEATAVYVDAIREEFEVLKEKTITFYENVIEPRLTKMGEKAQTLRMQLDTQLNKIEMEINALSTTMASKWLDQTEIINQSVEAVTELIQVYIDRVAEFINQHPSMESLRTFHANTMDKFNTYSDIAYNKVSGMSSAALSGSQNYINGRLATVVSSETLQEVGSTLMNKLQFYYQYYDVADHAKMFMQHSKNVAAEYLNDYLTHSIDHILNDFKWVAYEPEQGRIEFELTIPTQFGDIDVAQIKSDLTKRMDAVVKHMAKYHFNMREIFYMYKPTSLGEFLPPYTAHAMIAGQHIRTFDRRHYDFSSGSCSYILARDFDDGNFTVTVNYDGAEQSLTVHSNGMVIDIQQDNTVKQDGAKIELPVQFVNTTITRLGHKVIINSKLGVEVVCDNEHGLCTVEMSGFYFAKTGGLFGTYNNEPLDDFTTSSNKNETDVSRFTNTWALSRCNAENVAQTFTPIEGTKEYTACAALFKDASSPFVPCFSVVDPTNAFHKCVNDMSMSVTSKHATGPCKAAKMYETECKMAKVMVEEPAQCARCDIGVTTIEKGATQQLPATVTATDVVFVVEEKGCNRNTDSKLPQLTKLIDASLKQKRFTDIRFGLVGFGGDGVHDPAHVHTINSMEFASEADIHRGTEMLRYGNGDNKDVFEAVDFAAQYPFRAGAAKIIVLIPCSDCSESHLSYRSLVSRLNNEDITVHLMNDFAFELTEDSKNAPTNYLFGMDNKAVFSMKDSKVMKGNTKLLASTIKPKDQCSYLALATQGTVFDLNMMTKQRSYIAKSMQTVFAGRLAMTQTPSKCQICTCEYSDVFDMPRTVCKRC